MTALDSLPIGKTSGILEGPTSFHIVRVENRRPAGPASFDEVRTQIRPMLYEEKVKTEKTAFIQKFASELSCPLFLMTLRRFPASHWPKGQINYKKSNDSSCLDSGNPIEYAIITTVSPTCSESDLTELHTRS